MVFNSLTFLVFFAAVLALYHRLGFRAQNWMLLGASYVFYGWWDYRFLGLLLFTSLFDYFCALQIEKEPRPFRRKLFVTLSIIVNLGVLGVFKYFNFFAAGLESALGAFGLQPGLPALNVVLPLGISFYTFLSMSYTIDVFRGELTASRNVVDFLLYVAFFPHLVAGPIVRASYLLPQCRQPRVAKRAEVENGLWLILMGYVKKTVIADRLAQIANWGFSPALPVGDLNAWIIVYAFAFQIYADFSGYSDIARGLAKLLGFELVVNFRAPYFSRNPPEFWSNWHISLSTWLRDYLYIPLGGNRLGKWKTYRNLMSTMLLGGLWHGAGLAYVLWGLYHGALLCAHRWWGELRGRPVRAPDAGGDQRHGRAGSWLRAAVFFQITCVGWLLFRAGSVRGVGQGTVVKSFLEAMAGWRGAHGITPLALPVVLLGGLGLFLQWKNEKMDEFSRWNGPARALAAAAALAAILVFGVFEGAQFIYFQF